MSREILFGFLSVYYMTAQFANGANILYLCAVPSPSHQIWNGALANGLAARGHNVTLISPDLYKNPPKNVHYIHLEGIYNDGYREMQQSIFKNFKLLNPLVEPINFNSEWYWSCREILETKGFQTLLQYPDDFHVDLIINDFTCGGCLLAFMHKFNNPPLISVTAYGNPSLINSVIGGHQYHAYVPHYYLHYENDMTVWQRLYNVAVHFVEYYDRGAVFNPKLDEIVREKFGSDYPTVTDLEHKTAIAFVNTHSTFQVTTPLPENVIAVGGLHIHETKPLPKDLENFIASSKKGAVLFSLGTFIRTSLMDTEKQKIILNAFEQLPDYHFVWKFEDMIDLELPKNVLIRSWLPQSDILAHPKVKAFFTHSGLLSTQEAIARGIPILGMPFLYDQHTNLLRSIRLGFAEGVDYKTMTTEIIKEKLQKILEDPKYTMNVKNLSAQFRDQKEKPLDRAIWWTEWVLRNPNVEFLKSPVLRLGFIKGNSYDVIALITLISTAIILILAKVMFLCIRQVIRDCNQTTNRTKTE